MSEVAVAPSVVAGMAAEDTTVIDTMVIKKSCVLRGVYELVRSVYISPLRVVPHPLNRGRDSCKPKRCRSISGDVSRHGCDVTEAEQNAVLIESPPDQEAADKVREVEVNPDYDAHFAENVLDENDMCIKQGVPIVGGSVSHSHFNVVLRNVQTGKVGCECPRTPVVAGG